MNQIIWGPLMLGLLVGTGIFLTIRLRFLPWRNLSFALRQIFSPASRNKDAASSSSFGDISPFQSLMTSLAATLGTGNIVGVATAMVLGGPGALIWMWLSALFGLSTKYAESVLAVRYRRQNENGEMSGGPMYAMKYGLKNRTLGSILAFCFSLFTVLASFGIGNMTQANSVSSALRSVFDISPKQSGFFMMLLAFAVLIGGIKSIGKVCGFAIPAMSIFYVTATLYVLFANIRGLPAGLSEMFHMAFSPAAVTGGVGGTITASLLSSMRFGISRGVFSNEAGLGSAPIAAAAAKTDTPSRQGYVNMTGTFFDTLLLCTLTGITLASTGVIGTCGADGSPLIGVELTLTAYRTALGAYGDFVIAAGITLFAFSTILGWEYYGEKALEYLTGSNKPILFFYRTVYCVTTYIGATTALTAVWNFSDAMNGLMAIPNLLCLIMLHNDAAEECFRFQKTVRLEKKQRRFSRRK